MVREIRYTRNEGGGKGPVATGGKGNMNKELWRGKNKKENKMSEEQGRGKGTG